jgi:hypothetical protein
MQQTPSEADKQFLLSNGFKADKSIPVLECKHAQAIWKKYANADGHSMSAENTLFLVNHIGSIISKESISKEQLETKHGFLKAAPGN